MKWKFTVLTSVLFLLISFTSVSAAVPDALTLTLRLLNSTGGALNEQLNTTINVYGDVTGGSPLYNETKNVTYNAFGVGSFTMNSLGLPFDVNYYLDATIKGELLAPRINITPAPYARTSANATYASGANYNDLSNTPTINGSSTTDELDDTQLTSVFSQISLDGVNYTAPDNSSAFGIICNNLNCTLVNSSTIVLNGSDTSSADVDTDTHTNSAFAVVSADAGSNHTAAANDSALNFTGQDGGVTTSVSGSVVNFVMAAANTIITSFSNVVDFSAGITTTYANASDTLNSSVVWASSINGSLSCSNIVGGSDSDFCTDDDSGGGGSVASDSKWIDNGTFISPNSTSADDIFIPGTINTTSAIYSADWSNVTITESQITDLSEHTNITAGNGFDITNGVGTVAGNTCLDQDSDGLSITADCVTGTQLADSISLDADLEVTGGNVNFSQSLNLTDLYASQICFGGVCRDALWNLTIDFGASIDDTELTNEDFGDFTCTGSEDGCTVDANAIALSDDTTGNFVATIAGAGIATVTGSGSENAAVTVTVSDHTNISAGNGASISNGVLTVAGNTALTQDSDGLSVTADAIDGAQLADTISLDAELNVNDQNVTIEHNLTVSDDRIILNNTIALEMNASNALCLGGCAT